mgnify:CR=1 FL=1
MKRPQPGYAAGWFSKWEVVSFEHEGVGIKAGQHHATCDGSRKPKALESRDEGGDKLPRDHAGLRAVS